MKYKIIRKNLCKAQPEVFIFLSATVCFFYYNLIESDLGAYMTFLSKDNSVKIETVFPNPVNVRGEVISLNRNTYVLSWPEHEGMPNVFNRTALFAGEKASEHYFTDHEIASYVKDYEINYTGPALDKKDYQVFQLCLHAGRASGVEMGYPIRIFPNEWFKILGRTDNSTSRDILYNSLKKLTAATLNIIKNTGTYKEEITGNLLSMAKRSDIIEKEGKFIRTGKVKDVKWLIAVNPYTKDLFVDDMTLLDIHRSSKIKSHLGLWLHDFYSSHHNPIPIDIRKLHLLSGSKMSYSHFMQSLKEALVKLEELSFLKSYKITEKSKTEKLLSVTKYTNSPVIYRKNLAQPEMSKNVKVAKNRTMIL